MDFQTFAVSAQPIIPINRCYRCSLEVSEGVAFCDDCRGTALFQRLSRATEDVQLERTAEKVKALRSMSVGSPHLEKEIESRKMLASGAVLLLLSAFTLTIVYMFVLPH